MLVTDPAMAPWRLTQSAAAPVIDKLTIAVVVISPVPLPGTTAIITSSVIAAAVVTDPITATVVATTVIAML